jgi:hypothetical protein
MRSFILFLFLLPALLLSQTMVKEPSTEKNFPSSVTFESAAAEYTLNLTGLSVRKKYFFKVYGIAHYMQDAGTMSQSDAFKACLADGKAKQITMDFARDVDNKSIIDTYNESFKEIATKEELASVQSALTQYLGYFDKEVKENQQYVLRWIPGGTILATIQGEEKPPIANETFARVLWSIWLGPDSVVDRDDLVARIAK